MIRFATKHDGLRIREFIHSEWKADHILSRDERFFKYEHGHESDDLNFVISLSEGNKINGILGFIPSSDRAPIDICTVLWKVSRAGSNPFLGVELLEFLRNCGRFRTVMSVGINKKTEGIYKFLGLQTGVLKCFVLLNEDIKAFHIAKVPENQPRPKLAPSEGFRLVELSEDFEFDFDKYQIYIPHRDRAYFIRRFFQHPIYSYKVYGIYNEAGIRGLMVTRIQSFEKSKALRIVEYIGDEADIAHVAEQLMGILREGSFEYADFYCAGFDYQQLEEAGFVEVKHDGTELIIPNYFAPFVKENIAIRYFADTQDLSKLRICKSNGDQDRPN